MSGSRSTFDEVRQKLRARGMRWTPQRRSILEVLTAQEGHVTGSEIVQRCRERDALTTASTVYRTLEVLEEVGYLHHSHGPDGHQEYHVLPATEHAHLRCEACGQTWEVEPDEARGLIEALHRGRGFEVDLGHLTIAGRCRDCGAALAAR